MIPVNDMKEEFFKLQLFLEGVRRNPKAFSTLVPTLSSTAKQLVRIADFQETDRVLELGSGTGAITKEILNNLPLNADFVGIEQDPSLVSYLVKTFPAGHFIQGDASQLGTGLGEPPFQKIVASLPWTMFSQDKLEKVLFSVNRVLQEGGRMVFFITLHRAYSKNNRHLLGRLNSHGFDVHAIDCNWLNIPPVKIYTAEKIGNSKLDK